MRKASAVLYNPLFPAVGINEQPELPPEPVPTAGDEARAIATRDVYLQDWTPAAVYRFADLIPGQVVAGPALIESDSTTVLLRPGDQATTTPQRWLDIAVAS